MDMVNGWSRRFSSTAVRIFGVMALALLLTTAMTSHAGAEPNNGPAMDKGAFKAGCESGGGSFIDNPDGSFQCNLPSGGVIKCTDTTSPCTYTPLKVSVKGKILANTVGALPTLQSAAPAPVVTNAGAAGVAKTNVVLVTAP